MAQRSDPRLLEYESDADRQQPERTVAAAIGLASIVLLLATALVVLAARYIFGTLSPNLGP